MVDKKGIYLRRPAELVLDDGELVVRYVDGLQGRERYCLDSLYMVWVRHPKVLIPFDVRDALLERKVFVFRQYEGQFPFEVLFPRLHDGRSKMLLTQTQVSLPLRKNLWVQVLVAMLRNQREVLRSLGLLSAAEGKVFQRRIKEPVGLSPEACHLYYRRLFEPGLVTVVEEPWRYFELAHEVLRTMMKERLYQSDLEPCLGWYGEGGLSPGRLYNVLCYPFYPIVDWLVYEAFRYRQILELDEDCFAEVLLKILPCSFPSVGSSQNGRQRIEVSLKDAIEQLTERVCFCYGGDARQLGFVEVVGLESPLGGSY